MEKQTYYVDLQSREISRIKYHNNHHFQIEATEDEIQQLRRILNRVYEADLDAYWRSHIPFIPYHRDIENDRYDQALTEAFQLLYELGDENTKEYIETSGVLSSRSIDHKRS